MSTNNTFQHETTVAEFLTSANIPGLTVKTTADVNDAKFKVISKPTAIVALGDENTSTQNNWRAVIAETVILVYLVLRGAIPERSDADAFFREEIFQTLHGVLLPGMQSELEWRSTAADYQDNARTYLLTFVAKTIKRKR